MKPDHATDQLEPWLADTSDASPQLRSFLRLAAPLPDEVARVERLRQRLGPWLAVVPPLPTAPAPAPVTSAAASGTSAGGTLAGLAGIGKVGVVAVATAAVAAATWGLGKAPNQLAVPAPSAAPSQASAPQLSPPERNETAAPVGSPKPAPNPARAAASSSGHGGSAAPSPPSTVAKRASLAAEAAELATARRSRSSSPALTLALLRRHAIAYPYSTLAEERQLFTIEALITLGLRDEAKRELSALQQCSPHSPHLARAERLLSAETPAP